MIENIAMIVFACTAMNHLGLIGAAEEVLGRKLPVLNCCKCSSFWASLACGLYYGEDVITILAISFLASIAAIWLELGLGYMDKIYDKAYVKIYGADAVAEEHAAGSATTTDADNPKAKVS